MIYIRTCAYNAEKTLEQAVGSVLGQTYQDFEYHILDNGSTDRTGELIRAYAKKDRRIIPYYNRVNRAFQENPDFWNLSKKIPEGGYFCILDADDAYFPAFFEEMLKFMKENRLEMAACGTVFVDTSGRALGGRALEKNVVIDSPAALDAWFPAIHWNLRQVWGKLYSAKTAAARIEIDIPDWFPKAYGGDTVNVMECAKAAKRFGVYGKILHAYTVSDKSVSHQWIPGRAESDVILHEKAIEFLKYGCGRVSPQNLEFLHAVYFNAVKDTLQVLFNAWLPLSDKLVILRNILNHNITKAVFAANLAQMGITENDKLKMLRGIFQWLESRSGEYTKECGPALSEFCCQLNPGFSQLLPEEKLFWYMRNAPQIVTLIAAQDYETALRRLGELDNAGQIFPVVLAQTLAALLQNEGMYLYYSKYLIETLLNAGDFQRAAAELDGWESIFPEDEDFAAFRTRLTERGG